MSERREQGADAAGVAGLVEPGPHQLGNRQLGVSGDGPRVDGQPGLACPGQDVAVVQVRVDQVAARISGQLGGEPGGQADPAARDRVAQSTLQGPESSRDFRRQVTKPAEPGRGGDGELADQLAGDLGRIKQAQGAQRPAAVQLFQQQRAVRRAGFQQPHRPAAVPGQQRRDLGHDVVAWRADLEHAPLGAAAGRQQEIVVAVQRRIAGQLDLPPAAQPTRQRRDRCHPAPAGVAAAPRHSLRELARNQGRTAQRPAPAPQQRMIVLSPRASEQENRSQHDMAAASNIPAAPAPGRCRHARQQRACGPAHRPPKSTPPHPDPADDAAARTPAPSIVVS